MKNIYSLFLKSLAVFFTSTSLFAQPVLKPSIGLSSLPADNTPICNIVCANYNINTEGLPAGDTIPQFQFYTLTGTPYDAQSLLSSGKPLCIVAGSFTCPIWRGKITDLNNLIATYGSQVNFLVVYVVEAHPNTPDVSPYSCNVWTTSQNQTENVLYLQPTTYGDRKTVATDMINNTCGCMQTFNCPMVIDGPCNEYWTTFGEAPNNAYLINPLNGTIYCKHGWFNQAPNDMGTCISSLLATLSSVEEQTALENVSVYPNPSTGEFIVSGLRSAVELSLYNVLGEKILSQNIASQEETITVNETNGMYFYKLQDENGNISSGKLIIK